MDTMRGAKDRGLQLVVLTDGADYHSRHLTEAQMAEKLAKPGMPDFHMIAICVGSEARKNLEPLCVPRHCTLITVSRACKPQ
jgi:hypothetical protein